MPVKLTNEQKEFIKVFMLTEMGSAVKRKDVKRLLLRYQNRAYVDLSDLGEEFGDEFYYALLDALNMWQAGIAWGAKLSAKIIRGKF